METKTEPTWGDTFRRLVELWPRWKPTDAEREVLRERLMPLRQQWLIEAVKEHRVRDATGFAPKFDVLLKRYASIAHAGDAKGDTAGKWRAVWTDTRDGQRYAMSSLPTFETRDQALAYAGNRPDADAYIVGESFGVTEDDARIAAEDDREVTDALLRASAGDIATAVEWCRSNRVMLRDDLDADPRKWSRFARGVVYAALERAK